MSHDFDPTTGNFNSGKLPEPVAQAPSPPGPAAPSAPPPYRPPTSSSGNGPYAPRTSAASERNGCLGYGLLVAAVLAMLHFVGPPRAPSVTPPPTGGAQRARPESTVPPESRIEVLPPASLPNTDLTRNDNHITVTARDIVLDAPWVIDRPTVINGRGPNETTILYAGPGTLLTIVGDGTLRVDGVTLARSSNAAGNVITAESGTVELVNARLSGGVAGRGYSGAGLVLDGSANARVERTTIEYNAVGLRLLTNASVQMIHSDVRYNDLTGILIAGAATGDIRDSRILGNGEEGIVASDDGVATIDDNRVLENGARGFSFLGRSEVFLNNNEVARNGFGDAQRTDYWQGIAVQDDARATVQGNTVRDNAGVGIQFLHRASGAARNNTVTGNSANRDNYLHASGRQAVSAGGLVLGMLGQPYDPRPDVHGNRIERNTGGDVVDYRPTHGSVPVSPNASSAHPAPPQVSAQVYVLASTSDGTGALETDGRLNVYLADVPILMDTRPPNGAPLSPIILHAERGMSLWIEVVNPVGKSCRWSDVYLIDREGRGHLVLPGTTIVSGCPPGVVALVEVEVP